MATTLNPYISFGGNCEQAMKFYAEALGGKLEVMRMGDAPPGGGPPVPAEAKNRVMHSTLKSDGLVLMASDSMPGQPVEKGGAVSISLDFSDGAEQEKVWKRLSDGAKITMPLGKTFFGNFGMLTDKFGIHWMLNHHPH